MEKKERYEIGFQVTGEQYALIVEVSSKTGLKPSSFAKMCTISQLNLLKTN